MSNTGLSALIISALENHPTSRSFDELLAAIPSTTRKALSDSLRGLKKRGQVSSPVPNTYVLVSTPARGKEVVQVATAHAPEAQAPAPAMMAEERVEDAAEPVPAPTTVRDAVKAMRATRTRQAPKTKVRLNREQIEMFVELLENVGVTTAAAQEARGAFTHALERITKKEEARAAKKAAVQA